MMEHLKPFNRKEVEKLASNGDWDALREYDLKLADLSGMDLRHADLSGANMSKADLTGADLKYAELSGTDLRGAVLYRTDMRGAQLTGTVTDETTQWFRMRCPEKGEFVGYKKAYGMSGKPYIVKLLIPEHAKRSSATTEKCRCSEAEVLSIMELDGSETDKKKVYSRRDGNFAYTLGETVRTGCFDTDRWEECAPGIHFFMERKEATGYSF